LPVRVKSNASLTPLHSSFVIRYFFHDAIR
jgi:hypothetical protein